MHQNPEGPFGEVNSNPTSGSEQKQKAHRWAIFILNHLVFQVKK